MGRLGVAAVALALLGVAALYRANPAAMSLPGLSGSGVPDAPGYVDQIGTPAPVEIPADPSAWFPEEPGGDPYDPGRWSTIDAALAGAFTPAGWAALCGAAAASAGADRAANPLPGALACSSLPAVTAIQEAAARILAIQAAVALWMRGVPGYGPAAIEARQAVLRHLCEAGPLGRDGQIPPEACSLPLDASWREGDGATTFDAAGEAYRLLADEIAVRDPETAAEPAFYEAAGSSATPAVEPAAAAATEP